MLSDTSSLCLLESVRGYAQSRQNLFACLLPPSLRRPSFPHRMLVRHWFHHLVNDHYPVLDNICMHSNPVLLGQRRQGEMSGCWRHWICKQRVGHHTRLGHSDHAYA